MLSPQTPGPNLSKTLYMKANKQDYSVLRCTWKYTYFMNRILLFFTTWVLYKARAVHLCTKLEATTTVYVPSWKLSIHTTITSWKLQQRREQMQQYIISTMYIQYMYIYYLFLCTRVCHINHTYTVPSASFRIFLALLATVTSVPNDTLYATRHSGVQ